MSDDEVIRQFKELPKMFAGREVTIRFVIDRFTAASPTICKALKLEIGATVSDYVELSSGASLHVHAERANAAKLLKHAKGTTVRAKGTTSYGVYNEWRFTDDGCVGEPQTIETVIVKDILEIQPSVGKPKNKK